MTRLYNWPARFVAYLEQHADEPFAWGSHDCITFAAGAVRAVCGVDVLQDIAPWRDPASAAVGLRRVRGLAGAVSSVLGVPLITPALAQRADILLVEAELGDRRRRRFVAVCDSDRWVAPHARGLVRGPMSQALLAWRV